MKEIFVTINNKKINTTPDKTILQVVHENNIDKIPTLCNDDRIEPYGSCFVCVVEVEGVNRLLPSCATRVTDGMVITTNSKKVMESRKMALELLLSNHYADCIGPCVNNCPAGVDAQGYIALIAKGKFREALRLIKENNPLPLSIGRVCVRDCEIVCRRNIVDETVGINYLKRYVADIDMTDMWTPETDEEKEQKIAVVGGGPSGLSCAYYLRLKGYRVKIFEKNSVLGGMLRYGIPEYRLPKKILDKEISWITGLGIDVETNVEMGKDFTVNTLLKDGFASIYIAVGAQEGSGMRVEYEETTEGVFKGIDFLRDLQENGNTELKGTVGVVGGGNTAIDAARTALRCGADNVKILYRRSEKEMPAHSAEIEAAKEEGVEMNFLTLPTELIRENSKLKGVRCIRMELKDAEPGERPRPVPVEGSGFDLDLDYLIAAIGQKVDISFNDNGNGCKLEKWGTIIVNDKTMETSLKGVFAGGDVVTGPFTAITSIAHGKKSATSIDKYLQDGVADENAFKFYSFKHKFNKIPKQELSFANNIKKQKMRELDPVARKKTNEEVELGFTDTQACNEVTRCLECGCSEYYDCSLRKYCDEYNVSIDNYMGEVRKFRVDNSHPFITLDPNKCINCGKCVRTCSEILKVSALGFVNRGFKSVVKPAMEKSLLDTNCISCGNCIDVCPTGAIAEKYPHKVMGTLKKDNFESICDFCSLGCTINYKVIDNDIFYVSNSTDPVKDSINNGYLCVRGRFGHRYLNSGERLLKPLIRKDKNPVDAEWDEALNHTVLKIKDIIEKYGPGSVAVFGSPKLSNEELYLLSKFTRAGLKSNNIACFSNLVYGEDLDCLDNSVGITTSSVTFDEIEKSDLIIAVNAGLSSGNLILEQKIKAAQKKGAKFVLINSAEIKMTEFADLWIDTKKGTNTVLLNGMVREIINSGKFDKDYIKNNTMNFNSLREMVSSFSSEKVSRLTDVNVKKYEEFVNLTGSSGKKIIFIYNIDSGSEKAKDDLKAIGNFQILTSRVGSRGEGIIILRDFSNSQGVIDMGVSTDYLPGQVKFEDKKEIDRIGKEWNSGLSEVFKPVDLKNDMLTGEIKAAIFFGEDPYMDVENLKFFNGIEFLVVSQMFNSLSVNEADVVLPSSSRIEQSGSYTASDTMIRRSGQIFYPKNGIKNWEIIKDIASKFSDGFEFNSEEEILKEIKKVNKYYNGIEENSNWNKKMFESENSPNGHKFKFQTYETDISVSGREKSSLLFSEEYFKTKIKYNLTR